MRAYRFAAVLFAVVAVWTTSLAVVAQTLQLPALRRAPVPAAATAAPAPTFAPFVIPSRAPSLARNRPLPPFPPMPAGQKGKRRIRSAFGSSFTITQGGGCTQPTGSNVYAQNCVITVRSMTLPSATDTYHDYYQVPNAQTAPTSISANYTTAGGNGPATDPSFTLSQAGVYIVGTLDVTTNTWANLAYLVVGSGVAFDTFSDAALTTPTEHFTAPFSATNQIYVSASGLTPTDSYVYTVENTSDAAGACVFTAPQQGTYPTGLCAPEAFTGVQPSGGTFNATWRPTLGTPSYLKTGAYNITLYDQTTHVRVGQRQVTLSSTTGGPQVAVQFNDGTTTFPTGNPAVPRVAFNGGAASGAYDASETFINVYNGATGLTAADSYTLSVADPTGNVVQKWTMTGLATLPGTSYQYGLPSTAAAALANVYGSNVWTTTLYDNTSKTTVSSRAWQVLGYSMAPTWPDGSTTLQAAANTANQAETITLSNNGDVRFGDSSNADSIQKITIVTQNTFPTMTCPTCSSGLTDSNHVAWTATVSAGPPYTITLTAAAGSGLAPGATLSLPLSITTGGTTLCPASSPCKMWTSIEPLNGRKMSATGSTGNPNPSNQFVTSNLQITDVGTGVSGDIFAEIIGNTQNGNSPNLRELPGFTPYANTALGSFYGVPYANQYAANAYAAGQPFAASAGFYNVYGFAITNTSTSAVNFNGIAITLPPGVDASKVQRDANTVTIGGYPNTTFTVTSCGGQNNLPPNTFCITGLNVAPTGLTYFYVDLPQSTTSFPYTQIGGVVNNYTIGGTNYNGNLANLNADGTRNVYAPSQGATLLPANTIAAYSLDSTKMLASVTPSQVGTGQTNTLVMQVQNTPYTSDPFPDWVDGLLVEIPTPGGSSMVQAVSPQSAAISPVGWSILNGGAPFTASGYTYYWFGLCTNEFDKTNYTLPEHLAGITHGGDAPTADRCTLTQAQEALQPGQTFSLPLAVRTGTTTGAWTGYIFAHGANGNGWSTGTPFTVNVVNGASASTGFSAVGPYPGVPPPLTPGVAPQVGGSSNVTFGNDFTYTIANTGATGASSQITKIVVTLPNQTNTGADGADTSGNYPKITATPTQAISGGGGSGTCSGVAYTNPTSGAAGTLTLTGCTLNAGDSLTVSFPMIMPYRVNTTYAFPATVYAAGAPSTPLTAQPTWSQDQTMTITSSAVLTVQVNPAPTCSSTGWNVNSSTNLFDFGSIAPSNSRSCSDAVTVDVYTPVAAPYGWAIYASIDNNPATTGIATPNEAAIGVDTTYGSCSASNVSCGTTTYTVLPTSPATGGFLVAQTTNGGTASQSTPFVFRTNFKVSIGTETVTQQQHTVTYTWISN